MKAGGVIAVAAAIAGGVNARSANYGKRHGHQDFHERGLMVTGTSAAAPAAETCGCTTIYTTITGEPQLYFPPAPTSAVSSSSAEGAVVSPSASVATPAPVSNTPVVVPTPLATTVATPGVYTIPATTVTLTESTTVCGATSTSVASAGTYTVGGVTTVVTESTTVVCPYAAVSTSEGVVTSTILTTTYVCPSAGTYTIAPLTTSVPASTVLVYPTPASYAPGTYTQPEVVTTVTETNYVIFCPYSSSLSTLAAATSPASVPAAATTSSIVPAATSIASSVVAPVSSALSSALGEVATPATSVAAVASSVVAPVSSVLAPASSILAPASSVVAPVSSVSSVVASASSVASSVVSSVASSVASSSAKASSTSSASSGGNGGSVGNGMSGTQWAMTYSPYQDNKQCKTEAMIATDIALIAARGFKAVRIYSTDCKGLEYVGAAAKIAGIKLILGIYIDSAGCSGAADQVTEIVSWGMWELVELIVVGNEAVFNGFTSASALASFISSSRSAFSAAGYTGPVTTTEPLNIWQANVNVLCSAVDITGANLHPFFNAQVTAANAGDFALSQLEIADTVCPGLSAINLETGWPSAGSCNGAACPGEAEQKTAVEGIIAKCGGRAAIFAYTNELWKDAGNLGCEQSWGSIHLF
ncbi:hypothetical protein CJF30_00002648 [Rutstroemia sp. NJR-2017a BBW]|nr:hypothetical protein CJF30_00002648 [Rutstroemia sp. NJR-2017a BBW]